MSEDITELVKQIKGKLDLIPGVIQEKYEYGTGETTWTKLVKQGLVDLGNEKDYYTCASGIETARHGEWLWDVCWISHEWIREGKNEYFMTKSIPFACESEWGDKGAIMDDFQKLLCADIGLGLMIYQCGNDQELSAYQELCEQAKEIFHNGAKRKILLACYSNESRKFHYTPLWQ